MEVEIKNDVTEKPKRKKKSKQPEIVVSEDDFFSPDEFAREEVATGMLTNF